MQKKVEEKRKKSRQEIMKHTRKDHEETIPVL